MRQGFVSSDINTVDWNINYAPPINNLFGLFKEIKNKNLINSNVISDIQSKIDGQNFDEPLKRTYYKFLMKQSKKQFSDYKKFISDSITKLTIENKENANNIEEFNSFITEKLNIFDSFLSREKSEEKIETLDNIQKNLSDYIKNMNDFKKALKEKSDEINSKLFYPKSINFFKHLILMILSPLLGFVPFAFAANSIQHRVFHGSYLFFRSNQEKKLDKVANFLEISKSALEDTEVISHSPS